MRLSVRLAALWLAVSYPAAAAYTQPEIDRVARLYADASPDAGKRARAELARTDHAPDETEKVLSDVVAKVRFDDAHREVLHQLLLGPGSEAARSDLAPAVVAAVTARASQILATRRIGVAMGAVEVAELGRIYDFLRADLAAGDSAVRDDARKKAVETLRAHFTTHAPTLSGDAAYAEELSFVRARAMLAVVEIASTVLSKGQVADLVGLRGPARSALERGGYLLVVDGKLPTERVAEAARLLEAAPAFGGVGVVVLGKRTPSGIASKGGLLHVSTPLSASPSQIDASPFPSVVEGSRADALASDVAWEGARLAAARLFAARPALAERAKKLADKQVAAGSVAYLTTEAFSQASDSERPTVEKLAFAPEIIAANAARAVLIDAPRALDAALARGRAEPLEQLRLGLTLLALPSSGPVATSIVGGKTRGSGAVDKVQLTDVALADDGLVGALTLDGQRWDLAHTPPLRDGKEIKLSMLATARIPKLEGDTFVGPGGRTFQRLSGKPRVSLLDDGRVRVVATRAGLDAIGVDADGDVSVRAELLVDAQGAAIAARASAGEGANDSAFTGVALLIRSGEPSMAALVIVRPDGKGEALTAEVPLPEQPERGYAVTLSIKGSDVTARVGAIELAAKVDGEPKKGRVAIAARGPGYVEARGLTIGKPLPAGSRVGTKKKP